MNLNSNPLVFFMFAVFLIYVCACIPSKQTPQRDFQPIDLLIDEDGLPPGWSVGYQREEPFNALGFRKNLGGGTSRLRGKESNADHIIAHFQNAKDAKRSYEDHDYTRNTKGNFARTYSPLPHFAYQSEVADNFRMVCTIIANTEMRPGELCIIEAQYEEFLSVLIYRTDNASLAVDELTFFARAIDVHIGSALGKLE